jgi:hypothetical protein
MTEVGLGLVGWITIPLPEARMHLQKANFARHGSGHGFVSYMGQCYAYAMGCHMHPLLQAQVGKARRSTKEGRLRRTRHQIN